VPTQLPSNPTAATPTAPLFLEPTPRGGPTSSPATGATAEVTAAPVPQSAAPGAQTAGGATLSAPATGDAERAVTGKPVRLVIERIAVDRKLIAVGLDKNRLPVVPDHDVGWYTLGAQPGQGENVVLWGHVLRFRKTPDIPAPFAQLKELKEGDAVTLYDAQGNAYRYVVTQQVWATPDEVEYMLPSGREQVTMISCIGDKVIEDGSVEMTHRLITIAEPDA
jgi:LPXTG-site transpeptidase (sortase) family protein